MFGRIALFVATNILIVVTISILTSMLGLNHYMSANGMDYQALFVFCLVWGMSGSLISLMLSRISAKYMMGVQVIDPQNPGSYSGLVSMVHDIARKAGLSKMPEVGVFQSPEMNAFATGPTKNRALVAVSTGILSGMDRSQLEGVIGHEMTHITNGDMVTMTLLQGVVNAFVMFLARAIAFALSQNSKGENRYMMRYFITFLLEIVIGMFGMLLVRWFSRRREFKADAGSAKVVGRQEMISALKALQQRQALHDPATAIEAMAPYKISNSTGKRKSSIFATHPPLEERIARLTQYA